MSQKLTPEQYRERVREGDLHRELTIRLPHDIKRGAVVDNLIDATVTHDELYRFAQAVIARTPDIAQSAQLAASQRLAKDICTLHGYDLEYFQRYNQHVNTATVLTPITWKQLYMSADKYCAAEHVKIAECTVRDYLTKGPKHLPLIKREPKIMAEVMPFNELSKAAYGLAEVLQLSLGMIERELKKAEEVPSSVQYATKAQQTEFMQARDEAIKRLGELKQITLGGQKLGRHLVLANQTSHQDAYASGFKHMREGAHNFSLEQRAEVIARVIRTATGVLQTNTLHNGDLVAQIARVAESAELMTDCVRPDSPTPTRVQGPLVGLGVKTASDINRPVLNQERAKLRDGKNRTLQGPLAGLGRRFESADQITPAVLTRASHQLSDGKISTVMSDPAAANDKLLAQIASYQENYNPGRGRA